MHLVIVLSLWAACVLAGVGNFSKQLEKEVAAEWDNALDDQQVRSAESSIPQIDAEPVFIQPLQFIHYHPDVVLSANATIMTASSSAVCQAAVCDVPLLDGRRYFAEFSRPPGYKGGTLIAGVVGPGFNATEGQSPSKLADPDGEGWLYNAWDGRYWHGCGSEEWVGSRPSNEGDVGIFVDLVEGSMSVVIGGVLRGPMLAPGTLRGPLLWAVYSRNGNSIRVEAKAPPNGPEEEAQH